MVNKWLGTGFGECRQQLRGQPFGSPAAINQNSRNVSRKQYIVAAQYALFDFEPGSGRVAWRAFNRQHIVKFSGPQKLTIHAADNKSAAFGEHAVLIDTQHAEKVGSRPLAKFEIIGMVDVSGKISVFVIDAQVQAVNAVGDGAS